MNSAGLDSIMIAPCGMNCGICLAHLRDKKKCLGCNGIDEVKPRHCVVCKIRNCEALKENKNNYCFSCKKFPCTRLSQLDHRYRTKYGMSMINNLNQIKEIGIDRFLLFENQRWACEKCGDVICVHYKKCSRCGYQQK